MQPTVDGVRRDTEEFGYLPFANEFLIPVLRKYVRCKAGKSTVGINDFGISVTPFALCFNGSIDGKS